MTRHKAIRRMDCMEGEPFLESFLPGFKKTLNELQKNRLQSSCKARGYARSTFGVMSFPATVS